MSRPKRRPRRRKSVTREIPYDEAVEWLAANPHTVVELPSNYVEPTIVIRAITNGNLHYLQVDTVVRSSWGCSCCDSPEIRTTYTLTSPA